MQDICPYKEEIQGLSDHEKDLHNAHSHDTIPEALKHGNSDYDERISDDKEGGEPSCENDSHASAPVPSSIESALQEPESSLPTQPVLPLRSSYRLPQDLKEFSSWVSGHSPEDAVRVISSIRVSNHKELNAAVKMKLEVWLIVRE